MRNNNYDINEVMMAMPEAQRLIDEGWYQISRSYRSLARFPEGKTGIQALIDHEQSQQYPHPGLIEWANGLGEGHAGDSYLRCNHTADTIEVSIPVFNAYRKLGGGTYLQKEYEKRVKENA